MEQSTQQPEEQKEPKKTQPEIVPSEKKGLTIKDRLKKLPEKKPHLDFIAAILTIPLLALTLYLNISNLKNKATTPVPSATPQPTIHIIHVPENITPKTITTAPQPTSDTNTCIKDIGPIDISYPTEGQTVSDNPLCIQIDYQVGNYCSVVWSYRINSSSWSDYSNNSVCLYNLPSGNNTFQLQIKSLSSPSTQTLTRHFVNGLATSPTPTIPLTPTPTIVVPTATP